MSSLLLYGQAFSLKVHLCTNTLSNFLPQKYEKVQHWCQIQTQNHTEEAKVQQDFWLAPINSALLLIIRISHQNLGFKNN